VRGCKFIDGHAPQDHIVLEQGVKSAIVTENIARGEFNIIDRRAAKKVIRDNLNHA